MFGRADDSWHHQGRCVLHWSNHKVGCHSINLLALVVFLSVVVQVSPIVEDVRTRGDAAVKE